MFATLLLIWTSARLLQFRKALVPMLVTAPGITIDFKLPHPRNAWFPRFMTPAPRVTLARPRQDENAFVPMTVTLSGIRSAVNEPPENAFPPIRETPLEKTTFVSEWQVLK